VTPIHVIELGIHGRPIQPFHPFPAATESQKSRINKKSDDEGKGVKRSDRAN
jgi:hypothetical protein